jgi:hypothetical protein
MPDEKMGISAEYSAGSQSTTAAPRPVGPSGKQPEPAVDRGVERSMEPQRYGTGKPKRVVIRGNISRA